MKGIKTQVKFSIFSILYNVKIEGGGGLSIWSRKDGNSQ